MHRLEIYFNQKIDPEHTLIFFDEIQACERALTSLKYFQEEASEYHVIAAGSLLGVAMNRERYSFPVGKVEQLNMYPMTFQEFLLALQEEMLLEEIRICYVERRKLDYILHEKALQLYREYLIVGGMPEAVEVYVKGESLMEVTLIQQEILNAYVADMAKYASPTETAKILACFDSIPTQLAKDNKKFQYKVVAQGGKASLFGASFKLYMSDVGLLTTKAGVTAYDIISGNDHIFIGALTENYIANVFEQNEHKLYYWTSGGNAEIDFILEIGGKVIPVEVKAREHVKSRSLSVYNKQYNAADTIRISGKNFGFENGIISLPLYAAWLV